MGQDRRHRLQLSQAGVRPARAVGKSGLDPKIVKTIPRRGRQFVGVFTLLDDAPATADNDTPPAEDAAPSSPRHPLPPQRPRRWPVFRIGRGLAACCAGAAALGLVAGWHLSWLIPQMNIHKMPDGARSLFVVMSTATRPSCRKAAATRFSSRAANAPPAICAIKIRERSQLQKQNRVLIVLGLFLLTLYLGYAGHNYIMDSRTLCTARISELRFPRHSGEIATTSGFIDLDMKNETIHFFLHYINRLLQFNTSYGWNGEANAVTIVKKTKSPSEYGSLASEYHIFDIGTRHLINMVPVTRHVTQVNFDSISFFCETQEIVSPAGASAPPGLEPGSQNLFTISEPVYDLASKRRQGENG